MVKNNATDPSNSSYMSEHIMYENVTPGPLWPCKYSNDAVYEMVACESVETKNTISRWYGRVPSDNYNTQSFSQSKLFVAYSARLLFNYSSEGAAGYMGKTTLASSWPIPHL